MKPFLKNFGSTLLLASSLFLSSSCNNKVKDIRGGVKNTLQDQQPPAVKTPAVTPLFKTSLFDPPDFSYEYSSSSQEMKVYYMRQHILKLISRLMSYHYDNENKIGVAISELSNLQRQYPNDPELVDLATLLKRYSSALQGSFDQRGSSIKTAAESILTIEDRVKKEVKPFESDEYKMSPDDLVSKYPQYKKLIDLCERIGNKNIDYVVRSKKPNAPSIAIASQTHFDLFESVKINIVEQVYRRYGKVNMHIKNMRKAHDPLVKIFKKFKPEKLFLELVNKNTFEGLSMYFDMHKGWEQVIEKSAIVGLEGSAEHKLESKLIGNKMVDYGRFRLGYGNVLMADNVIDDLSEKKVETSGLVIGYAHERKGESHEKIKNGIPLSALLAAGGVNVVVLKSDIQGMDERESDDQVILVNAGKLVYFLKEVKDMPTSKYKIKRQIRKIMKTNFPLTSKVIRKRGRLGRRGFVELVYRLYIASK